MLIHHLKRYSCPALLITNHNGESFPDVVKFDRILVDVPCTGDGTLRKAPDLWRRWNPEVSFAYHRLQVAIAWRAVQLLKPGGRLVYSTCSFNPLEDEAVVCEILRRSKRMLKLVDVSSSIPGLKRRPGLVNWKVKNCSPNGTWFESFDEVPRKRQRRITKSMFPPTEREEFKSLRRCLRLFPQDQDTGGFFIAVLEAVGEVVGEGGTLTEETEAPANADVELEIPDPPQMRTKADVLYGGGKLISQDPLVSFREKVDEHVIQSIVKMYSLPMDFVLDGLLYRASEIGQPRKLYHANKAVVDMLPKALNELNAGDESALRIVFAGVRIMEHSLREGAPSDYRLCTEGIHLIYSLLGNQKVSLESEDYARLLSQRTLPLDNFGDPKANDEVRECHQGTVAFQKKGASNKEAVVSLKGAVKLTPLIQREMLVAIRESLGISVEEKEPDGSLTVFEADETRTSAQGK